MAAQNILIDGSAVYVPELKQAFVLSSAKADRAWHEKLAWEEDYDTYPSSDEHLETADPHAAVNESDAFDLTALADYLDTHEDPDLVYIGLDVPIKEMSMDGEPFSIVLETRDDKPLSLCLDPCTHAIIDSKTPVNVNTQTNDDLRYIYGGCGALIADEASMYAPGVKDPHTHLSDLDGRPYHYNDGTLIHDTDVNEHDAMCAEFGLDAARDELHQAIDDWNQSHSRERDNAATATANASTLDAALDGLDTPDDDSEYDR